MKTPVILIALVLFSTIAFSGVIVGDSTPVLTLSSANIVNTANIKT